MIKCRIIGQSSGQRAIPFMPIKWKGGQTCLEQTARPLKTCLKIQWAWIIYLVPCSKTMNMHETNPVYNLDWKLDDQCPVPDYAMLRVIDGDLLHEGSHAERAPGQGTA